MALAFSSLSTASLTAVVKKVKPNQELAFSGAEGFGAVSKGGAGGRVIKVTSLQDDPENPQEGTLRWAVEQKGARIVEFNIAGTIQLKDELHFSEPYITIDGAGAPGLGVCVRDHTWDIKTHDVIVRNVRIRRGDVTVLEKNKKEGRERPVGSGDLDCVTVTDAENIIFDHCSLSWSCDEIFGIIRCKNLTIQWCIIGEPLSNPSIHPYGDNHAFCVNCSGSTFSIHHCLIARFVMRGPQFEANDVVKGLGYDIKMEAINNLIFDYRDSGSRYTTGIENNPKQAKGTNFDFQFINNYYVSRDGNLPEIYATPKHGVTDQLRVFASGNVGPHNKTGKGDGLACVFTQNDKGQDIQIADGDKKIVKQLANAMLFTADVPVKIETAAQARLRVLDQAGCKPYDSVDKRLLSDAKAENFRPLTPEIKSQDDVGGWPKLS